MTSKVSKFCSSNQLNILFQGVSQERIEIDPVLQPKAAKKFWGKQKFVSISRKASESYRRVEPCIISIEQ